MEDRVLLLLLAVLFCTLIVVHRIARRQNMRRRQTRRAGDEQKRFGFKPVRSARSEMRANEDSTTTLMRDLDAKKRPRGRVREKASAPRGK